jgi:FMN phosphatase YigB (HAD superfamily)
MIKIILLDLDDTLIKNPGASFVEQYLRLGNEHFSQTWGYTGFPKAALSALHAMRAIRTDMRQTNGELSVEVIAKEAGRGVDETRKELDHFYTGTYSGVHDCIQPIYGTAERIEALKQAGYGVVIATNPIYPAEAVRQRMVWGGLEPSFEYYSFVSHADNTHFAKPNPAYYAEILARVGVEPDEAIMVGDNHKNDIQPAAQLGIRTFHISDQAENQSGQESGTFRDFCHKILDEHWSETMRSNPHTPEMIEPQLQGNIGALFGLIQNAKPRFWLQHPDPEEWSPLQIICHLAESEGLTQRPRLKRIKNQDNPFLAAPREPLGPTQYHCKGDGDKFAHQFASARQETIDWLRTLEPDDWQRPARHSIFGTTTLLEMVYFTAQHDRLHLNQLCQTLGNCE